MLTIIAEIGSVHDGSIGNAICLIDAAADAGANAVKFQTHIAEAETIKDAPNPSYFKDESRFDYFERTSFSVTEWGRIAEKCNSRGVQFISSPFSLEAIDLLKSVGVTQFKVPSGEVSNVPLLEKLAEIQSPVLLSSGMSNWDDLDRAVSILKPNCDLTVMQCTSEYPCRPEGVGLNIIKEMQARYSTPVGFSDHTMGMAAALGAVCSGAQTIEKHFTFSRLMYGSDAKHSMEPKEFAEMIRELNTLALMLDNPVDKSSSDSFHEMKQIFEKSIVASRRCASGELLTMEMMAFKKPGNGIPAAEYRNLIGKKLVSDLSKDQMIKPEDLLN